MLSLLVSSAFYLYVIWHLITTVSLEKSVSPLEGPKFVFLYSEYLVNKSKWKQGIFFLCNFKAFFMYFSVSNALVMKASFANLYYSRITVVPFNAIFDSPVNQAENK